MPTIIRGGHHYLCRARLSHLHARLRCGHQKLCRTGYEASNLLKAYCNVSFLDLHHQFPNHMLLIEHHSGVVPRFRDRSTKMPVTKSRFERRVKLRSLTTVRPKLLFVHDQSGLGKQHAGDRKNTSRPWLKRFRDVESNNSFLRQITITSRFRFLLRLQKNFDGFIRTSQVFRDEPRISMKTARKWGL